MRHDDNMEMLLMTMCEIANAFGLMFISCELCQRVNLAFDECGQMVEQFEWYSFPDEIQRMLPLILQLTQQPVDINCFGSSAWNRETFKYVSMTKMTSV